MSKEEKKFTHRITVVLSNSLELDFCCSREGYDFFMSDLENGECLFIDIGKDEDTDTLIRKSDICYVKGIKIYAP